jgi:hypothetical protein
MPIKWYGTLFLIVLLGVLSIVYSRYEDEHPIAATAPTTSDHWYAALAIDVCGQVQPDLPTNPQKTTPGLHTDGDGVLRIEPKSSADAGTNATLGRFVSEYPKLKLTSTSLTLPNEKPHKNGQTCPKDTPDAGKSGIVQVKVWSSSTAPGVDHPTISADPDALRLADGQLISIAFVPSGSTIPMPSATIIAAMDQAISAVGQVTTTVPITVPSTTLPTTGSTTTPSSSTSSVPASPTTTGTQPAK